MKKRIRHTIDDMRIFADRKKGKCLSDSIKNATIKLKWQCENNHIWEASWNTVQQGHWCGKCDSELKKNNWSNQFGDANKFQKNELNILKNIALDKGGECISNKYVNSRTKLKFKCKDGHIWMASPSKIKGDRWCPICGKIKQYENRTGVTAKLTLDKIQEFVQKKGGKCLSEKYVDAHGILEWQCKEGHKWKTNWNSIQRDTWCPICSQGISERICVHFFEEIFCKKFSKKRPSWLINSSGYRMELDGYCEELKLAVEYNGKQHYEVVRHHGRTESDLEKRKADDLTKKMLCEKNGIILISVPYTVKFEDMGDYIKKEAIKKGIKIPKIKKNLDYKTWNIYSPDKIKEMNILAKSKGGKCLSNHYINNSTHLEWECSEGHIWKAQPSNIMSGRWCPECVIENRKGSKLYTIDSLKDLAKSKGGMLLSKEFTTIKSNYLWKCKEGHKFETKASIIMYQNTWCPTCAIERIKKSLMKYDIQDLKNFAEKKGGNCLSSEFISSNTSMKWICEKGHTWNQRWSNIKKGHWCPECVGVKKLTIEGMQKIAEERRGKCLSLDYINEHSKLKWECSKGHTWEAIPYSVKTGSWCPTCASNKKGTIEQMQEVAKEKGGKCLSTIYVNAKTKLKWECSKGHTWEAIPDSIKRGGWCPKCSFEFRKHNWSNQFSIIRDI